MWLELRPLAYRVHPYKWATIGKEIKHIEEATMEDVKAFFKKYYTPSNAILCIAGDFELNEVKEQVEKWYGDIPSGDKYARMLKKEPNQTEFREKIIEREVPVDAFYYAFKMPERKNPDYYLADVLSDALGRDKSSRLYKRLKKELELVSEISAYITGSLDEGLLIISGRLSNGVSFEQLDEELWNILSDLQHHKIEENELKRLMIKIRTAKEFQEQGLLNRAMNLCLFELLGDANGINEEALIYEKITSNDLLRISKQLLRKTNCSLLKVQAIKK